VLSLRSVRENTPSDMSLDIKRNVGIFLFTSSILSFTVASRFLLRSHQVLTVTSKLQEQKKKHSPNTGSSGVLIANDVTCDLFLSGMWKYLVSKEDETDKVEVEDKDTSEEATKVELEFVNKLQETILVCFVDCSGKLFHYYPINDKSINDGSVSNRHLEFGYKGHSFVCIRQPHFIHDAREITKGALNTPARFTGSFGGKVSKKLKKKKKGKKEEASTVVSKKDIIIPSPSVDGSPQFSLPKYLKDINPVDFVCIYRPSTCGKHKLEISYSETSLSYSSSYSVTQEKKNPLTDNLTDDPLVLNREKGIHVTITCEELEAIGELIDSSKKDYDHMLLRGFQVFSEPGVFEMFPVFHSNLEEDLAWCEILLPPLACALLKKDTRIWVNKQMVYGSKKNPIVGRSCTYHPQDGKEWLLSMGMSKDKSGGIEIFCPNDYIGSRNHWGLGGGLLHELSHSFHDKHCQDGFDNTEICQAYTLSMGKRLYDVVNVHGSQGEAGPTKAYACANACEFFAELSTAFLWDRDETTEYNKWFPHNRYQLSQHDPDSCEVIRKMWNL